MATVRQTCLYGRQKLDHKYTEILINYVRDNPVLYKREASNSHWNMEKNRLWWEFAQKYNLEVKDCKVRWKSIRNGFFVQKKRSITHPHTRKYLHADLLSFLDEMTPVYFEGKNRKSSNTERVLKENPKKSVWNNTVVDKLKDPKFNFDATVVTTDMLMQILEMRQKGQTTNIPEGNSIFQTQDDTSNEQIPICYSTSFAETSDIVSFRVPKLNFEDKSLCHTKKLKVSTAPEDIIVIEDDAVQINNTVEDSRACSGYLHTDGRNTESSKESSNSDKRIIETQYRETEGILRNNTENLNVNLDSSKDSTEKFFDEMGEYVENRFPEDKQQELKLQIWNLLAKNDNNC